MNRKAFTLIELLVVLAIIGLIVALGVPQLKRVFRANLKSASVRISGMVRYAYDAAAINGRIYRIVFDFDKSTYRLEVSNTDQLVSLSEEDNNNNSDSTATKPPDYSPAVGEAGKEYKLPNGVVFDSIENLNTRTKIMEEIGYLYFFPQGRTEEMIIRLKGDKNNTGYYSIRVASSNAKTKIEGRYIEAEK